MTATDDLPPQAGGAPSGEPRPLRIVRGDPSPEEVAALVAVLAAASAGQQDPAHPPSRWASRDRLVDAAPDHGPGQWRASALPR